MHTKVANPGLTSVRLGLYTNNAGAPGTLLGSGLASSGFTGTAPFRASLAEPIRVIPGVTYWIGVLAIGENFDFQGTSQVNGFDYDLTTGQSTLPNPWTGTRSDGDVLVSIWAEQSRVFDLSAGGRLGPPVLAHPFQPAFEEYVAPLRSTPYKDAVLADFPISFVQLNQDNAADWQLGPVYWGASNPETSDGPSGYWPNAVSAVEDGHAYFFNSTNNLQYISASNVFNVGVTSFTIEFWYRHNDIQTGEEYTIFITQEVNDVRIAYQSDSFGGTFLNVYINNGGDFLQWSVSLDGGWHHVVLSSDSFNYNLYVDNNDLGAQTAFSGTGYYGSDAYWGADPGVGSGGRFALDEMALYDYPLSGYQVSQHWLRSISPPPPVAGAQNVNVNRVTETDAARGIVVPQNIAVTRVIETDAARGLTDSKSAAVGRATETDVARTITWTKARALTRVTETGVARTLTSAKVAAVNRVTETGVARTLTLFKSGSLTRVTETNVARALAGTKARSVNRATETDITNALARLKTKLIGRATETDSAGTLTKGIGALNRVIETDAARALTASKVAAISRVSETGVARSLVALKSRLLSRVAETDLARALAASKVRGVGRAVETDAAQALNRSKVVTLGRAIETDSANTITSPGKINRVTETDIARPLVRLKTKGVNRVIETNLARVIIWTKSQGIAKISETNLARTLVPLKTKVIVRVTETDTARPLTHPKSLGIARTVETDTARLLVRIVLVGRVFELDSARTFTIVRGTRYMGKPTTGHATGGRHGQVIAPEAGRPRTQPSKGRPALS